MSAPTRGISAEFQSEDPREKYLPARSSLSIAMPPTSYNLGTFK